MNPHPYRKAFLATLALCLLLVAALGYQMLHRSRPTAAAAEPSDPVVAQGPPTTTQTPAANPSQGNVETALAPVQIAPERLQQIGVTTAVAQLKDVNDKLDVPGNVDVDEERLAYVQTRFPGWIQNVAGEHQRRTNRADHGTLVVVGELDSMQERKDCSAFFEWLRRVTGESRRVCSVCTGAFCLAQAGLLDGRRVTTHWQYASILAKKHPAVQVDSEPLFLRDGKFYTSAGCTAAMDLSLALVEEDIGFEIATEIARDMIMFLRRPGRHAQISPLLKLQMSERKPMRELQTWMLENLNLPLTVEDLAEQVHMSPRNFARSFVAAVGTTPARFLETLRLEVARRRLEETDAGMDQIASDCGFGSAEVMRRSFARHLGVPPSAYRRQSDLA